MATDIRLKESLPELTARLVKTYGEVSTLNHLGHCPLPNYETIISVIRDLREVLYPGFGRRDGLHMGNITYHTGDLIDRMHDQLTLQIARACCHEAGHDRLWDPHQQDDFEALAQAKTVAFLRKLPELREVLALDVEAALAGDPACKSFDEVIFCYPGLEAVTVYRLAHLLHEQGVPLIPRMMTEWRTAARASTFTPARRLARISSSTTGPAWSSARRRKSANG